MKTIIVITITATALLFLIAISQERRIGRLRFHLNNLIVVSKQLEDEVLEARDRLTEGNS